MRTLLLWLLALPLLATPASALTLCVNDPDCTGNVSYGAGQLQEALDDAAAIGGTDVVRLGAGTYTGSFLVPSSEGIRIIGAGIGQTVIQSSGTGIYAIYALRLNGGASAEALTIVRGADDPGARAVTLAGATLRDARVTSAPGLAAGEGLVLAIDGSVLERTEVVAGSPSDGYGVKLYNVTTVRDSEITMHPDAGIGVGIGILATSFSGGPTVTRTRISGAHAGVHLEDGVLAVTDSVIDLGARQLARGLVAHAASGGHHTLTLNVARTTIVGSGANQLGVLTRTTDVNHTVTATVAGTLMHHANPADGLAPVCEIMAYGSVNALTVTRTASAPRTVYGECGGSASDTIDITGQALAVRDAAAGDYTPVWGSPLIDAGAPGDYTGVTDMQGRTRAVAATGGAALPDIGAFEYGFNAPQNVDVAVQGQSVAGQPVTFTAMGTDALDGEQVTFTWAFGDGGTGTGINPVHTFAAAGAYPVTITATDTSGRTATATRTVSVTSGPEPDPTPGPAPDSSPGPTPGPTPTPAPPADTLAPQVTGATRAVARRAAPAPLRAATRGGARLALSEDATLTVTLQRGPRTLPGTVALPARAGTLHLTWGGMWQGARLPRGTYRYRITARDGAGNVTARAHVVTVTLR